MASSMDSMKTLFNICQKEHESLQDYTERFNTAHGVMKSPKFVKNMKGYDKGKTDEIPVHSINF
jgi:hypothetical protein